MRLLLAAAAAMLAFSRTLVRADVTVTNPADSQLPLIAHIGTAYNWTLQPNTFTFTALDGSPVSAASTMSYAATGLPSWAQFHNTTLTFSGNPSGSDEGGAQVEITASLLDNSLGTGGNSSATTSFTLLTLHAPAPTLALPIAKQLLDPASNSLGPSSVLPPGNVLHIPPGWSFSMGFSGDTFVLPEDDEVFMAASVNGSTALPSWMTWSADTYTLYGVAPFQTPAESTFDVVMTGSNRYGYGGMTDSFQIQVSSHALSLGSPLPAVNASVGNAFTYQIPTTQLYLDSNANDGSSNPVNVSVNLADLSWLMFDQDSATISGAPPFEQYQNASTTQVALLPIVYSDTYGNHLHANLTINIAPYGFTVQVIPNAIVASGSKVNVSLAQYIRNTNVRTSLAASNRSTASRPAVSAVFDPANATQWLTFNANSLSLLGTMPADPNTKVKVNLAQTNSDNQTSTATLYVETPAVSSSNSSSTAGGSSTPDNGGGSHHGLSRHAKIALGVTLGCVGGLLALIILMICCRRFVAKEQHDHHGYVNDDRDDQTLTDTSSHRKFGKAIVVRSAGAAFTPTTMEASPYFDQEKQAGAVKQPTLASVTVEDPNGEKRDVTHEADEPIQSRLIGNLFGGKRKEEAAHDDNHVEANGGVGLGLGMEDAYSNMGTAMTASQSQGGIGNFQSERSMKTHRSSWESDLFYEDASTAEAAIPAIHNSLTASDDFGDLPRRRGTAANDLTVRQRTTHQKESPAFHTPGIFTPPEDVHSQGSLASQGRYDDNDAYLSETYGSRGQMSASGTEDAQIMEAKVMQVRRHSPMIHTNGNPFSQIRGRSAEAEERSNDGAFDDAEWESMEDEEYIDERPIRRPQYPNQRASTTSTMTDSSQMQTMRAHYANEEVIPAQALRQPDIFSPNPSFMDGASLSGYEPQETMRAVPSRPRTPPNPFHRGEQQQQQVGRPRSAGSTASRFLACPCVAAIVNYPVRFHIYPTVPPPMAGAPGSPGKRSGEGVRYSLIVDDHRPHLLPFRMTWPDMLGDWLTFNDATFEAFGIVPDNAGLEDLGDVEIALIAIKRTAKVPPSPKHSPTKRHHKRTSTLSFDSSHTVITEDDITVVARAKLVFQAGPQAF